MRVYLAGPFFNKEQTDVMSKLENYMGELGIAYYSPRIECYCPPNSTQEQRESTFKSNYVNLQINDIVLARIDDFDPGTMWEIGYAYAARTPVYAFTTVEGRGLNLMLAQSCKGFLIGLPSVFKFLKEMDEYKEDKEATKWLKPII